MADTKAVTTEDLLNKIGNFGRYQVLLLLFANYAMLCWGCFTGAILYLLIAEPRWECVYNSTVCNITGSIGPGEELYEYRCGISRQDWTFIDEYTSIITQFDLVCAKSTYGQHVITITSFGGIAGSIIAGIVSDKFGRKTAFFLSGLVVSSLLLLVSFSQNYLMFAIPMFFIGLAYYGVVSTAFVLMVEYVGIKYRSMMGNGLWLSYGVGFMILAGIGYLVREWRMLTLIVSLSGVPCLAAYWLAPESLRWLIVKKRLNPALRTLKRIAKINKKVLEDDIELPTFKEERKVISGDIRLLFSSGYTISTLVVWYSGFSNAMMYSGVHLSAPSVGGSVYFNWFLAGISELASTLCAMYAHNRFGRKKCVIVCEIMAAVSAFGSVILTFYDDGSKGFYVGKIIMSMVLAKFFITISYDGILLMAAELYPTIIRNVAQGTASACAGIGSLVSAYVTYLIRVHPLLPYGIMGANALISGLLCLTLKETRDLPILEVLPESEEKENHYWKPLLPLTRAMAMEFLRIVRNQPLLEISPQSDETGEMQTLQCSTRASV